MLLMPMTTAKTITRKSRWHPERKRTSAKADLARWRQRYPMLQGFPARCYPNPICGLLFYEAVDKIGLDLK